MSEVKTKQKRQIARPRQTNGNISNKSNADNSIVIESDDGSGQRYKAES